MSPGELLTVTFPLSRLGRRGYEAEPVRDFLREVHAEFVRLVNDRAALWQEVQRLRRRVIAGTNHGDPQAELPGETDGYIPAPWILSTGQAAPGRQVAGAQANGSRLTEAQANGSRLTEEVTEGPTPRRDEITQEARRYWDMIMEDAHARAREAAASALNASPPPQSAEEQRAAQAELAYVRTYSDGYRAHLRAYTEGILHGIEEWERKDAASLQ